MEQLQKDKSPRLSSRKFWVIQEIMILSIVSPIVMHKYGMSESIILTVLGILGGVGAVYGTLNVIDRKING